jgi:hypothetical protein
MNRDEIQTAILQVCKVSGNDSDFNVLGFYALCDRLVELGAAAEREACAALADKWHNYCAWEGRVVGLNIAKDIRARGQQ